MRSPMLTEYFYDATLSMSVITFVSLTRRLFDCPDTGESALAALDAELNRRVSGLFGVGPDEVGVIEGAKDEKKK